ncbi:LytR C-terminal domain-containing protein [Arthrobacter sp. ISL-48]|uniref:LytR C-terminal domain-containing protein n=1 Tax=Arthrobacter sp. ISL-48 TaxID=2819110 RepID=UPI001BE6BBB7|nr:LytR C-terminal domain-containing protein [Arthrobacter sp. ISL-48]MBT2533147.1 LytR C-terminal domain-containing protein [Arthrobacter sp. ISL-48]
MTKYARDEFDKVPETASRQGVHRAAGTPSRRRLWPILAVGIAALAIGLVSFLILPKLGFTPAGSQASSSLESAASPEASAEASDTPQPSSSAEPSTSPEAVPSSTPSPTPSSAVVNKTEGVAVYNGSGTAGLAVRVSSIVQSDGWTLGQVGNWGGAPQKTSVIFYSGTAQKANAQSLAKLLNIPTIVESAEFQVPVVVVLGPGFK